MDIPYTTDVRPDTGLTNPKLGMWLFLASEVMLFGSFFSSYALLRVGAASWPDQSAVLSVPLAALNTAVLLASSVTIALAWRAARQGDRAAYRGLMAATIALGIVFLGVKGSEYADKLSQGLAPSTDVFLGLYYTMTGLHALHIAAGLAVNAYLIGPGARMWQAQHARFANRVELAALYWHFVDVIWICIFAVFYLL
ncbi:MAG: heme-copper oxidase subunit III [Acidimicrobiia bacterium]|nr:heme-copper oxidase subunit III [Acidimicrobiia bacterium]